MMKIIYAKIQQTMKIKSFMIPQKKSLKSSQVLMSVFKSLNLIYAKINILNSFINLKAFHLFNQLINCEEKWQKCHLMLQIYVT